MCNDNRKIMTYPFTGFDYRQIIEVGKRVRIIPNEDGYDVNYLVSFNDFKYGCKQEMSVKVIDEDIKNTLCYFSFLNSMCRYSNEVSIFRAIDQGLLNYNTYIDSILISTNEIISGCKYSGSEPNYVELLSRFGKQYTPNDLNKLYSVPSDYEYLNGLFNYLFNDPYLIHASRFNDNGVYFDKMNDGTIDEVVREIIDNKDDAEFFSSTRKKVVGPKLTKKIDYRVSVY